MSLTLRASWTRDILPPRYRHLSMYSRRRATAIDCCQYRVMSKSLLTWPAPGAAECCSPLAQEPMSAAQAERVAPLMRALGDPARLRLMSLGASHDGGGARAGAPG